MDSTDTDPSGARIHVLSAAAVAATCLVYALLAPIPPMVREIAGLLAAWLLFASLIRYVSLRRLHPLWIGRAIPIAFSGSRGRFRLLPRGDGRRVEVRAGSEVVVEAIATDERDELVLHLETVQDDELEELGTAIGQAIEMVALADEDA